MSRDTLLKILDLARWAPSGDNTQPWRFEIVSNTHIAIHGFDTRDHVLYDFDGHASHMAHGALLETLRLAATRYGFRAGWMLRDGCDDTAPIYDVTLHPEDIPEDPLVQFIESRCVQRRAMRMTPLTEEQKQALRNAVGDEFTLQFFESFSDRLSIARLLWLNAKIRLTCPEAYPVHRDIIEWGARFSTDRIPEEAVGVDPLTAKLMRWVMQSWERVEFFNKYLGGTIIPRIQLDFIPALACAAHILMKPVGRAVLLTDHVRAGVALQRLWLTVTSFGFYLQPEMTPLIFLWYARSQKQFSTEKALAVQAKKMSLQFDNTFSTKEDDSFSFFCRVGYSKQPTARSLRRALADLNLE